MEVLWRPHRQSWWFTKALTGEVDGNEGNALHAFTHDMLEVAGRMKALALPCIPELVATRRMVELSLRAFRHINAFLRVERGRLVITGSHHVQWGGDVTPKPQALSDAFQVFVDSGIVFGEDGNPQVVNHADFDMIGSMLVAFVCGNGTNDQILQLGNGSDHVMGVIISGVKSKVASIARES